MPRIPLAVWTPGWMEMLIILAILLLVFGRRLPEVMRNIGRGLTQFKRGMHESVDEIQDGVNLDKPPPEKKAEKSGE